MHQLYVLFNSFNLARICIIYLFTTNISAQINENFNFNHISSISQLSNYHLFNTSNKKVLISSTEGLNIFDGLNVKIYRPSTHRMYGYNIQSPFFEDSDGKVWFTTYEALNYYDPRTDDLDYMFMVSSRRIPSRRITVHFISKKIDSISKPESKYLLWMFRQSEWYSLMR